MLYVKHFTLYSSFLKNLYVDKKSMKNNLGFVFTNFNNTSLTIQAVKSIRENAGESDYNIVVVDNCSSEDEVKLLQEIDGVYNNVHVVYNADNVGYFKGLNIGVNLLREKEEDFDYIVIGNNDLVFSSSFFTKLNNSAEQLNDYPVISPNIITLDGVHQNPHVIGDISRFREIVWDLYFSSYWLSVLISYVAEKGRRFLERKDYQSSDSPMLISQGYGACYILTKKFFKHFDKLWSPNFLMGEEFFLSKQLESQGFRFYYYPEITVQHHDHATVSLIPSKKLWLYSREYHKVYRKFISPYRLKMNNNKNYFEIELDNESILNNSFKH